MAQPGDYRLGGVIFFILFVISSALILIRCGYVSLKNLQVIEAAIRIVEADEKKVFCLGSPYRIRLKDYKSAVFLGFVDENVRYKPDNLPLMIFFQNNVFSFFPAMRPLVISMDSINHHRTSFDLTSQHQCLNSTDFRNIDFTKIQPYDLRVDDILYYTNNEETYHFSKVSADYYGNDGKIKINSKLKYQEIGDLYVPVASFNNELEEHVIQTILYFVKNNRLENIRMTYDSYVTLRKLIPQKDILNLVVKEESRF